MTCFVPSLYSCYSAWIWQRYVTTPRRDVSMLCWGTTTPPLCTTRGSFNRSTSTASPSETLHWKSNGNRWVPQTPDHTILTPVIKPSSLPVLWLQLIHFPLMTKWMLFFFKRFKGFSVYASVFYTSIIFAMIYWLDNLSQKKIKPTGKLLYKWSLQVPFPTSSLPFISVVCTIDNLWVVLTSLYEFFYLELQRLVH